MASDGKITIDLEINDHGVKGALDDVASKARGIPDVKINVSADTKGALGDIAEAAKAAKGVSGGEVKITGNNADAKADISEAEQLAKNVKGGTVEIKGNNADAKADIAEAEQLAKGVEGGTVTIKGNNDGALSAVDEAGTAARNVEGGEVVIGGEYSGATAAVEAAEAEANSASGTVTIDGDNESAISEVTAAEDAANAGEGKINIDGDNTDAVSAVAEAEATADAGEGKINIGGIEDVSGAVAEAEAKANAGEGKISVGGEEDVGGAVAEAEDKANAGEGTISILGDNSEALNAIAEVVAEAEGTSVTIGMDSSGSSDGSSGGSGGSGLGDFAGGVAKGAWNIAKNTMSSIFETGMGYEYYKTKASTLMPKGSDLDAYTQRMFELSMETGASMEDLMEGSYNALSATAKFGATSNGKLLDTSGQALADLMTTATKLGVAGYTDANTAAVGMMQILNATGKGQNEAGGLADIMLKSQNVGVNMDVGAQARQMASVVPTANLFGMGLEQTFANVTALTDVGMSLADATSATNRLILDMSKSSTKAGKATDKALKNLGYSSLKEYFQAGKSLPALLRQMAEDASNGQGYEKGTESFSDLFNAFGVRAASFLATTAYDKYDSNLAYLTNGESVLEGAYANMAGTTQTSLGRIKAQFQVYADELYDALAPAVKKLLGIVTSGEFKTFMSTIINKITGFLESDKFMDFVNGLKDAAMFLLDVLTGKRSWGELFGEIGKALQDVFSSLRDMFMDAAIDFANLLFEHLPSVLGGGTHIETRKEREERLANAQKLFEEYGGEQLGESGRFLVDTRDMSGELLNDLNDTIKAYETSTSEEKRTEAWSKLTEQGAYEDYWGGRLTILSEDEAAALSARIDHDQTTGAAVDANLATLGEYGIYDTASANRILQGGDESVISEVVAAIQALRENNPDADEWYNHSAADVYEETGSYEAALPYAQLENLLSGTTEGTEALKTAADETATGLEGASESTATLSENTATASTNMEGAATGMSELAGQTTATASIQGRVASNSGRAATNAGNTATNLGTASTNADKVAGALGSLATKIGSISVPSTSKYAVGLDRVPYDNYPALLHKGEMVLNAAEASAYRFGGSASRGGGGIDAQALAAAMQGLSVEMDGRTVGRLVERSVSREQGTRYNRQARVG